MNKIDLKDILQENLADDNQDYLSILGDEKEMLNDHTDIPDTLPILPLRNTVLFPGVIIPINIGREKSLKLIRYVYKSSVPFGVIAQRDTNTENPKLEDLYTIGTVATVLKILEMPDGTTTAIIQGKKRFELDDILYDEPYHVGKIIVKQEDTITEEDQEYNAIGEALKDMALKIVKYSSNIPNEAGFALKNIESMLFLINFISSNTDIDYRNKQELLEIDILKERATKLLELLGKQVKILELKEDIQKKVKVDLDKQQREYLLHQQMKTIQNELGANPVDEDLQELEEAARIDGCSVFRTYFSVVLPLLKPAMATLIIMQAFQIWNDYLLASLYVSKKELKTLTVAIQSLFSAQSSDYTTAMAAIVISVLPIAILFLSLQKYFIKGMTVGAVKG